MKIVHDVTLTYPQETEFGIVGTDSTVTKPGINQPLFVWLFVVATYRTHYSDEVRLVGGLCEVSSVLPNGVWYPI